MLMRALLLLLLTSNVSAFTGVDVDGNKYEYKNHIMTSKSPVLHIWMRDMFGGRHLHTFVARGYNETRSRKKVPNKR